MELLRDVGHVESHFGLFGCKIGPWFALNKPWAQKYFWMNQMVLLSDEAQLEGRFGPFGDSPNLDTR
jgi:hypothetical protein